MVSQYFLRASNTLENSLKYLRVSMRSFYPITQFVGAYSVIPNFHIYIYILIVSITIILNFLMCECGLSLSETIMLSYLV